MSLNYMCINQCSITVKADKIFRRIQQIQTSPDSHIVFFYHFLHNFHRFANQRINGPVNAHLISWPSKAQNIQNLENIW